jgi:porphobilinogen synthase
MMLVTKEKRKQEQLKEIQSPVVRPRRLRLSTNLRRITRETELSPSDFIYPLFIRYGRDVQRPIYSMPGQFQWTVDRLKMRSV